MKKLIYLFTLMTLVAFTSCNNSSEDETVQSFSGTIISRAINGNEVVFSKGNTQCTINLTKRTVQFSSDFKDADGHVQSLNSPVMDFVFKTSNILSFNGDGTSGEINDLNGYLDLGTGMFWYTLSLSDGTLVVSSTHPLYAYAKTVISNGEGTPYEHENSAYKFILDETGETCTMYISNFISNTSGSIQASLIMYEGLQVTTTATGYTITADEAASNFSSTYTITDLHFNLDNQCRTISGSFKVNGYDFNVSGSLFPEMAN